VGTALTSFSDIARAVSLDGVLLSMQRG
jgi:hypothetical protein